jgi:hypothetical protein
MVTNIYLKQVGTPTLPTAIPLKSSSSMRATLVFNLFLNETMLVFNPCLAVGKNNEGKKYEKNWHWDSIHRPLEPKVF